jgi:L,D-transpeptidase catalytic domain
MRVWPGGGTGTYPSAEALLAAALESGDEPGGEPSFDDWHPGFRGSRDGVAQPPAMSSRPVIPLVLVVPVAGAFALSQTAFSLSAGTLTAGTGGVQTPGRGAPRPAIAPFAAAPAAPAVSRAGAWRGHLLAAVRGTVPLRDRPRGPVTLGLGAATEFGGRRVLGVAARRGPWLGVVTSERPNGRLAWVHRRRGLRLRRTRYSLHADLSVRRLELRRNGRRVRRLRVAIGARGAPTPPGRYAVTDKLDGSRFGPYYGCCVLALSGHQPNLPPGWPGGNRLAIHGTDAPGTIGTASSAGCLRAADTDLRALMSRVPLGTPVFVHG